MDALHLAVHPSLSQREGAIAHSAPAVLIFQYAAAGDSTERAVRTTDKSVLDMFYNAISLAFCGSENVLSAVQLS